MEKAIQLGMIATLTVISLLNWYGALFRRMLLYYVTKPVVLVVLILFFTFNDAFSSLRLPFLVGLFFSLLGDIFLIPRGTSWFVAGVGAFALAHLGYIYAFSRFPVSSGYYALALGILLLYFYFLYTYIDKRAVQGPHIVAQRRMFKGYGTVVAAMAISALLCLARPGFPDKAKFPAALGGLLFLISDLMIGIDRLGGKIKAARFWIILSYHLGQFLIVAAAIQL